MLPFLPQTHGLETPSNIKLTSKTHAQPSHLCIPFHHTTIPYQIPIIYFYKLMFPPMCAVSTKSRIEIKWAGAW